MEGGSLSSEGHTMVRHGEEVAAWALPCGDSEEGEGHFAKTPLAPNLLDTNRSSSKFSELKRAFRHFLKLQKNLGGLPITPRSSTKSWGFK